MKLGTETARIASARAATGAVFFCPADHLAFQLPPMRLNADNATAVRNAHNAPAMTYSARARLRCVTPYWPRLMFTISRPTVYRPPTAIMAMLASGLTSDCGC